MMFPRISHLIGEPKSNIDQLNSVDYPPHLHCLLCEPYFSPPQADFFKGIVVQFYHDIVSPKHIIFGCFLRKGTLKS